MASRPICYYVTGHGFGHAIRTIEILKALPPDVPVIVKTTAPERLFLEDLSGRPVRVIQAEYDCGSVQTDDLTVHPRETLDRYRQISERNAARFDEEMAFLQREDIGCVVSDVPSFPLRVAAAVEIPGVAIANFTWADIYQEYAQNADDERLLREMRAEYSAATLALITPLSVPTVADPFLCMERVPLVARHGINVRDALCDSLGLSVGTHLALPYLGTWGLTIDWQALAVLPDWVFLTYAAPPDAPENVRILDRCRWPYADVAASVDAVLAKPGYGTMTECIANSVPLVYVPRRFFAEQQSLVEGLNAWRGGVPISEADFLSAHWGPCLETALACRPDPNLFATDGAAKIARRLLETALP
jgi:hypothetical protein